MEQDTAELLRELRRRGIVSAADAERIGVPRVYLTRLVRAGMIERIGRGLYARPGLAMTEDHGLVQAMLRVPNGVVCLLSALRFHGLTTIVPSEVWVAVPPRAKSSRADWPPIRAIRMSSHAASGGVGHHKIEGVRVRVYRPAKTIADCFKFRNKIGLDVALEALREYRRARSYNPDELWQYARANRVERILQPYLELLA